MLHHLAEARGEEGGLIEGCFRQEHADRIVAVARHPVVRAKELPREDPGPLEQAIADPPAVFAVDLRQIVDVEEYRARNMRGPVLCFRIASRFVEIP